MTQNMTGKALSRRDGIETDAFDQAWNKDKVNAHLACALARDCTELFYVNSESGEYIEYRYDKSRGELVEAKRDVDFFESCARDAEIYVHPDDREDFVKAVDQRFLTEDSDQVPELTFRRVGAEDSSYVNIKAYRMKDNERFIVIAVSDVDEVIRQHREEARIQEEREVYARLYALTGNFIVVYVVNPENGNYHEFSAADHYEKRFAQAKKGRDFFEKVRNEALAYNHPEDLDRFLSAFTKQNVMAEVERSGIFTLEYRVMMEDKPLYVQMKAAMIEEKEGPRLVVGLNDVDAQARQRESDREVERQREIYNIILILPPVLIQKFPQRTNTRR